MGSYYPPYWTILRSNTICLRKTYFFSIHENGLLRAYLRHCNINKLFSLQYFYTKYADFVPNVQDFTSKSRRKCKIPSRILPFGLSSWKFSFQSKTAKITSVTHTSRLIVHSEVFEVKYNLPSQKYIILSAVFEGTLYFNHKVFDVHEYMNEYTWIL